MLVLFTRVQRLSDQNHFGYDQRVDKSRPIRKIGDLKLAQQQRAVRGQRAEEESKIAGQDHNFLDLMHSGLLFSAIWKSLVFGCLVFVFHILEHMIKNLIHGKTAMGAFQEIRLDDLLTRTVIIVCTFIPLFAFREFKRVMGEDTFWDLLLHSSARSNLKSPQKAGG